MIIVKDYPGFCLPGVYNHLGELFHMCKAQECWTPDNYIHMWIFPKLLAQNWTQTIIQNVCCSIAVSLYWN